MSAQTKKLNRKKKSKVKAPSREWGGIKSVKRERLIYERKKKGLTQGELASRLGVSTATISHIENGRMNPGLDLEIEMQTLFNLSSEILFSYF